MALHDLFSIFVFVGMNAASISRISKGGKKKSLGQFTHCGLRKSIWHRDAPGVCQSAYISRAKHTQATTRYYLLCLCPSFRLRLRCPVHATRSSLCVNERRDGCAGSSITAAAAYITTASAGRPCENPCARECRCLSQAGMGSAMGNRTRMRIERDADLCPRLGC